MLAVAHACGSSSLALEHIKDAHETQLASARSPRHHHENRFRREQPASRIVNTQINTNTITHTALPNRSLSQAHIGPPNFKLSTKLNRPGHKQRVANFLKDSHLKNGHASAVSLKSDRLRQYSRLLLIRPVIDTQRPSCKLGSCLYAKQDKYVTNQTWSWFCTVSGC